MTVMITESKHALVLGFSSELVSSFFFQLGLAYITYQFPAHSISVKPTSDPTNLFQGT
jgi:hypothetical protein